MPQRLVRTPQSRLILFGLVFVATVASAAAEDWPQWGGPRRDFTADARGLARSWPEDGPRELWRRPLGVGYSGIAVVGGRLFTMYRRDAQEVVVSLAAADGRVRWEQSYPAPVYVDQVKDFGKAPNATPLVVDGRVYTVGFTSKLHCFDARTGTVLWSHDLVEEFAGRIQPFGHAASPIAYGDWVIVLVGGEAHGAVAFDRVDGSVRWKSVPLEFSYASPLVIDVDGEDQLVLMTPEAVVGVGMSDGGLRWKYPHVNKYRTNCQGPWWGADDLLFVSAQADAGSRTLRLARGEGGTRVQEVARSEQFRIFHGSAVRIGDHVFGVSGSELVAHNIRTGKDAWRRTGFPNANVVHADGKLILLDEVGTLSLAAVSPRDFGLLASHPLMTKPAWTAPSVVGTRLYARDTETIVAVDLGPVVPRAAAD